MIKASNEAGSRPQNGSIIGLLLSGGLDSAILLHVLLEQGFQVQPFYMDCGLIWQPSELRALRQYLSEVAEPHLRRLVVLSFPLDDLYQNHWSITQRGTPSASTPDRAVFLPGRNLYLVMKAALWCQLHGITDLALAILKCNPFPDATPEFFQQYQSALQIALGHELRIVRPFAQYSKTQVMELGRDLPLEHTFSCIAPIDGQHCGSCNKCAERQASFRNAGLQDRTAYVRRVAAIP
jgi:7-cyano-7-deazaguanine synthase